ncbi:MULTISPECIES: acyltransferase family protein [Xanthomonas]|uniref:Acyltransferase n=2 Tax=Xanthomonas TaxID=338 RepID=A0AB33F566_XANCI|nr:MULTISPECIES: acyltransferase [Xanthomonas]QWN19801.1 acyltransferase [Xanthomonas citri]ATS38136.1 acyltransferase [Xanthomonas citri pv. phaseoli var. fuscans]ATS43058.1 acyltransferase [Xanthomonas citri pv. phaseoli var. fuscans]ATS46137.1 acyltransferase [Xanthomonas citri pv. phaseoli var. fuscans]ATS83604.1 acyltransferase [Xanthomonas citri pv. phaseoli var. fuscans]
MVKNDRLVFLDALRGLAALYVVLFHVMAMPAPAISPGPWLAPVLTAGGSGVALFFVISAFSLCYTMPRHAATGRPMLSFYLHRLFRIAPLFYCWLAFSLYRDGRGTHAGHGWDEIAANVSFTFNLVPGWETGIVWASWAIGVEMLFYAVFPMLFIVVTTMTRALLLALCLVGFAGLAGSGMLGDTGTALIGDYGLLRHLPVFAIGLCTFFAYEKFAAMGTAKAQRWGRLLITTGALGLAATIALHTLADIGSATSWIASGLMYALLLVGLSQSPLRLVVNAVTGFLGKISYSVYLGHPVVIALLIPVFRRIQDAIPNSVVSYAMCAAATLLVTLPIASLTYRFIEVPAIALGKRMGPKVKRMAASTPPASANRQLDRA